MGSTADFVIPQRLPFSDQPELLVSDEEPSVEHRAITNTLKPSNELELLAFKGAFVTPTYGVHDQHGRPFLGSNLTRGGQPETNVTFPRGEPTSIEPPTRINISLDAALFINYLQFQNFGHLLTETSSSIYPLLLWSIQQAKAKYLPILINEPRSRSNAQLDELRQLFGLSKSQVISIGGDIQCVRTKTLFQAAPTHINRRYCSIHHSTIVRLLLEKKLNLKSITTTQAKYQKIYISRTKLKERQRQLPEEQQLIEHLARAGWIIFHPQEHPIEAQLKTYQTARDLCCLEGSALHLLFGVDCTHPPNVILICRKENNNFTRQLKAQAIPHHVLNWLEADPTCTKPPSRRDVRLKAGVTIDTLTNAIEERCTREESDEL